MHVLSLTMLSNLRISRSLWKFEMTLYYQQRKYNECIYFEESTTCLYLMDKYFSTLQLHSLNKGILVYNKVV